jgi:alkylation response protein AidB-like acyl-CoA dehydrogenase
MSTAVGEMMTSANMSLMMYIGFTHGVYSVIFAHGTPEQKALYLPRLVSGEWTGTMNLTEPQCGTDLRLIKTKAIPQADGSYSITGKKIFISCGEHDFAANIIHLVLARLPDAPLGIKGLSLFIVPKILSSSDGKLIETNQVSCQRLENKMGIHGSPTCSMIYDDSKGFLIGEKNKGLETMFIMMDEARIAVGAQGVGLACIASQNASRYAQERLQGNAVTGAKLGTGAKSGTGGENISRKNNDELVAEPIIVHPDVRRMLLDQRAFVDGARAFLLWCAVCIDTEKIHADPEVRAAAARRINFLTPVVKAFLTDKAYECCTSAQQVFGGYGYITDTGMEQLVRDSRVTMIYEGCNGIQALDLVGRKLGEDGGEAMRSFLMEIRDFIRKNESRSELNTRFLIPLSKAIEDVQAAGLFFMRKLDNPEDVLAGSYDFLHLLGLTCLGYMWSFMAETAYSLLENKDIDRVFLEMKLEVGTYYMQRHLPETALRLSRINLGASDIMAPDASSF